MLRSIPGFVQSISALQQLLLLCLSALPSYQHDLVSATASFLETLITLNQKEESQVLLDVFDKMVLQCLKSISEHNAYHLIYETSATPLSLLFALFNYRRDAFFVPFIQFFHPVQNSEVVQMTIVGVAGVCDA